MNSAEENAAEDDYVNEGDDALASAISADLSDDGDFSEDMDADMFDDGDSAVSQSDDDYGDGDHE